MSKSRDLSDFPAGALDIDASGNLAVTGSVTADGLTVDGTATVSGNVGIGTSSPSSYYADNLVVMSPNEGGITIASDSVSGGTYLAFADGTVGDAAYRGFINYSHGSDFMRFATGAVERLRIDSAGRLLVGTTTASLPVSVGDRSGAALNYINGTANIVSTDSGIFVSKTTTDDNSVGYGLQLANNANNVGARSPMIGFSALSASGGYNHLYAAINGIKTGSGSDANWNRGAIQFSIGGGSGLHEKMRLDPDGNLLVGKTAPDAAVVGSELKSDGTAVFSRSSTSATIYVSTLGSDGDLISFRKDSTTVGSIRVGGGNITIVSPTTGVLNAEGADRYKWDGSQFYPGVNNACNLGHPSYRWTDVYTINAVNSTSDRTQKQDILEITTAETAVAKACKGLLRSFRWKDAVAEKGDDARIHFGIMAQDLQDAFTAEGLDAGRYGMFMSNTWWETETEVAAVEAADEVTDEDGNVTTEVVEAKDAYTRTDTFDKLAEAPAGATERTRLGVRYTELLAFIIAAL